MPVYSWLVFPNR